MTTLRTMLIIRNHVTIKIMSLKLNADIPRPGIAYVEIGKRFGTYPSYILLFRIRLVHRTFSLTYRKLIIWSKKLKSIGKWKSTHHCFRIKMSGRNLLGGLLINAFYSNPLAIASFGKMLNKPNKWLKLEEKHLNRAEMHCNGLREPINDTSTRLVVN